MRKITVITFLVFMIEALVHYNQGLKKNNPELEEFVIPDNKQLGKIALTVLAFSVVTSLLIAGKWPTN